MSKINRRDFIKKSAVVLAASSLPISLVEIALGKTDGQKFTFGYISDSHITHIKGNQFVRNWDRGLIRAIAESNLLTPRPDFFFYGDDIAQLGKETVPYGHVHQIQYNQVDNISFTSAMATAWP